MRSIIPVFPNVPQDKGRILANPPQEVETGPSGDNSNGTHLRGRATAEARLLLKGGCYVDLRDKTIFLPKRVIVGYNSQ
jgi:hypothetical protein